MKKIILIGLVLALWCSGAQAAYYSKINGINTGIDSGSIIKMNGASIGGASGNAVGINGTGLVMKTGTVTLANKRLSIVNGTAFCDFSAANTLTSCLGCLVVVTDSKTKTLAGYAKAAGSSETLDETEKCSDPGLDDQAKWDGVGTGWSVGGGVGTKTAGTAASLLDNISYTDGALYKGQLDINPTAGGINLIVCSILATAYITTPQTLSGYATATATSSNGGSRGNSTGAGTVDNITIKQVLTPAATGVTITDAANGATYNWTSETTDFNRNDTSGYTYAITTN